jgi:hypothetical protein
MPASLARRLHIVVAGALGERPQRTKHRGT